MTPSTHRWAALDIARALAVIGVVLNHGVDGLVGGGLLAPDGPISDVNAALYVLRMPALAFLLGIFVPRGVEKRGKLSYIRSRAYSMLWVYLVWTLLQGSIQVALSSLTNGQMTFTRVLTLWVPIAQFWFLPALVTMTVAVVLLRTWGRHASLKVMLLLVPALALWGSAPNIAGVHGFSLVLFVGAGAALGMGGFARLAKLPPRVWAVVGAVSLATFVAAMQLPVTPATTWTYPDFIARAISIGAAITGIVVVIAIAMLLAKVPLASKALASIGEQTMPVYLMHILILAGLRVGYKLAGFDAPELFLAIAVPIAIMIPWAVGRHSSRLRVGWLFAAPRGRADRRALAHSPRSL